MKTLFQKPQPQNPSPSKNIPHFFNSHSTKLHQKFLHSNPTPHPPNTHKLQQDILNTLIKT